MCCSRRCNTCPFALWLYLCHVQLEDPAIRWQMALYRDFPNHYEDTPDPEKTVKRVLDIAHVLFHLDQVCVCLLKLVWATFLGQMFS